jgi:hypothetical protein
VTVVNAVKMLFEFVDRAFIHPDEMHEARAVDNPEKADKKLWDTFDGHGMVHIFHNSHFNAWILDLHRSTGIYIYLSHQTWTLYDVEGEVDLDVLLTKHCGT